MASDMMKHACILVSIIRLVHALPTGCGVGEGPANCQLLPSGYMDMMLETSRTDADWSGHDNWNAMVNMWSNGPAMVSLRNNRLGFSENIPLDGQPGYGDARVWQFFSQALDDRLTPLIVARQSTANSCADTSAHACAACPSGLFQAAQVFASGKQSIWSVQQMDAQGLMESTQGSDAFYASYDFNPYFRLPCIMRYPDTTVIDQYKGCKPGRYGVDTQDAPATSADVACPVCPAGKYSDQNGQTACKDCGTGKYQDQTAQTAPSSCKDCASGKYQDDTGQAVCKGDGCSSGTFGPIAQGSEAAATCTGTCISGKYQDQTGQAACKDCEAGRWQGQPAQSSCTPCGTGKYSVATASPTDQCIGCELGRYQDEGGQATCDDCGTGKYQDQQEQTTCIDCAAGKAHNSVARTAEVACVACVAGKYQGQVAQSSCVPCAAGTYSDQEAQTACKACPASQTNNADFTSCTESCPDGKYVSVSGTCANCPEGKYAVSPLAVSSECTLCEKGKYNAQSAQSSCTLCGRHTFADEEGLTDCKACSGDKHSGLGADSCTPITGPAPTPAPAPAVVAPVPAPSPADDVAAAIKKSDSANDQANLGVGLGAAALVSFGAYGLAKVAGCFG